MKRYRDCIVLLLYTSSLLSIVEIICLLLKYYKFNDFYLSLIGGIIVSSVVSYNDYRNEFYQIKDKFINISVGYYNFLNNLKAEFYDLLEINTVGKIQHILDYMKQKHINFPYESSIYEINFLFKTKSNTNYKKVMQSTYEKTLSFDMYSDIIKILDFLKEDSDIKNINNNIIKIIKIIDNEIVTFDAEILNISDKYIIDNWNNFKKIQKGIGEIK